MKRIEVLDTVTVSKIAAGEVIDRPSSVVKELIENSIDAESTQIIISIEDGGKKTIKIEDNGKGILAEDLCKAPLRHATSKIRIMEDIYGVDSYGFRGEALASMAHVGKLEIQSKTEGGSAYKIQAKDNQISEKEISDRDLGTTVILNDLFLGMPVRQKFLKSGTTESNYIFTLVQHISMIHPEIDFILKTNGQEKINTRGIKNPLEIARLYWGKKTTSHLKEVNTKIGPFIFQGVISDPGLTIGNRQKQITAVDGRIIKNPTLTKAIQTGYKDLIPKNRFPYICINIKNTQSSDMDVNIHPQKMDIKFLNPNLLFDTITKMISETLGNSSLYETGIPDALSKSEQKYDEIKYIETQTINPVEVIKENQEKTYIEFSEIKKVGLNCQQDYKAVKKEGLIIETKTASQNYDRKTDKEIELYPKEEIQTLQTKNIEYLHILDTYIALKIPEGIALLDQHAVHERILYEKIKINSKKHLTRQPLLVAEIIELDHEQLQIFNNSIKTFKELGFECEPFGGKQLIIREIPNIFIGINLKDWIQEFINDQIEHPNKSPDLTLQQKESLQLKACKAAIKAGKKMHQSEVKELLKDMIKSPNNYTCPHGRPLFIELNKSKLERLFLRS